MRDARESHPRPCPHLLTWYRLWLAAPVQFPNLSPPFVSRASPFSRALADVRVEDAEEQAAREAGIAAGVDGAFDRALRLADERRAKQ